MLRGLDSWLCRVSRCWALLAWDLKVFVGLNAVSTLEHQKPLNLKPWTLNIQPDAALHGFQGLLSRI